jgi:hypothetical protein
VSWDFSLAVFEGGRALGEYKGVLGENTTPAGVAGVSGAYPTPGVRGGPRRGVGALTRDGVPGREIAAAFRRGVPGVAERPPRWAAMTLADSPNEV